MTRIPSVKRSRMLSPTLAGAVQTSGLLASGHNMAARRTLLKYFAERGTLSTRKFSSALSLRRKYVITTTYRSSLELPLRQVPRRRASRPRYRSDSRLSSRTEALMLLGTRRGTRRQARRPMCCLLVQACPSRLRERAQTSGAPLLLPLTGKCLDCKAYLLLCSTCIFVVM